MNCDSEVATAGRKRSLELEAFSSLVDALRAAGPLTPDRKALLQQTANALKISADRYKAEIRRALAKPNLSGEFDETSWAMEGRRDTFLLPRKPPRSTLPAPYAAYTTRLTPALMQLPRAPYRNVETQTSAPKLAANPKLVVVSSPRSQTTHTMVYAKPGGPQRQVRICPQTASLPSVAIASAGNKAQPYSVPQQTKMVSVPTVVRANRLATSPVSGGPNSSCTTSRTQPTNQQVVVSAAATHLVQPQQHCKQIVITTPTSHPSSPCDGSDTEVNVRSGPGLQQSFSLQTVQVRPGTPVVTKVLHPSRPAELKVVQKPGRTMATVRPNPIALSTMSPSAVRLANGTNGSKMHSLSGSDTKAPPAKVIKSLSQWNYDDHSVMAKPALIAPTASTSPSDTDRVLSPFSQSFGQHTNQQSSTKIQLTGGTAGSQTRTVQIVQISTAQTSSGTTRLTKPVRMITPTQMTSGQAAVASNGINNNNVSNNNNNVHGSHNSNNSSSNSSNSNSRLIINNNNGGIADHSGQSGGIDCSNATETAQSSVKVSGQTSQQPRPLSSSSINVVVQSLPYQDYQGSIYKMVPEDVITEEEVA